MNYKAQYVCELCVTDELLTLVNNGGMKISSIVGVNIRKTRVGKKMSQEELAFEAGIARAYLSKIENGRQNPSLILLDQIAAALDVKITALFAGYKGN